MITWEALKARAIKQACPGGCEQKCCVDYGPEELALPRWSERLFPSLSLYDDDGERIPNDRAVNHERGR